MVSRHVFRYVEKLNNRGAACQHFDETVTVDNYDNY
jgi:hypothetical protein